MLLAKLNPKNPRVPFSSSSKEELDARRFCQKAGKFFYGTYFVILFSFILTSIGVAYAMTALRDYVLAQVVFITILSIVVLIYGIHPIWTVKFLTFSTPDKKLSINLRIKMDKLIRMRKLLQSIKKEASIPLLISIIAFFLVLVLIFIVSAITGNLRTIRQNNNEARSSFQIIVQTVLSLFILPFCFCSTMAMLWQLPFLFVSIWKIFTVNWFDQSE